MSDLNERLSKAEVDAMNDESVGAGSLETAPFEDVVVPWLRREPIITALIAANVPVATLFVGELASESTNPYAAGGLGMALLVLNTLFGFARKAVTPVARPRLDAETPLTPE